MEEIKKIDSVENIDAMAMQEDEESSFSLRNIMALIILNWQWFIVSLVITLCNEGLSGISEDVD